MKIKTITCHDVYNYGASLQAYALMKYLQLQGHEVEIIDYKPEYLCRRYCLFAISPKWNKNIILKAVFYSIMIPLRLFDLKRKWAFDKFTAQYLKLTPKTYRSNDELKNNPPLADIYIAGSDQIWNTSYGNGKDLAFYLDFAPPGSIKASYAASFSVSSIEDRYKDFVKTNLEKIEYIAVREKTGLNILESLGIKRGNHVLDPVFLLNKEYWDKLALYNTNDKYVLVYDFESNPLIMKFALQIAKANKLKIYAIKDYKSCSYADKNIRNAGPIEFLGLIKNCEYFLSNSFHGTVFSIIYSKEFYVFNRVHQKVNSRMNDLLELFQIKDRLIEDLSEVNTTSKIDYDKVFSLLDREILLSKDYILQVTGK